MTEIEQLRQDIEKLEAAQSVLGRRYERSCYTDDQLQEMRFQLAKLEAKEAAKPDPWWQGKVQVNVMLKWVETSYGHEAARYARHLEQRVAELEEESRCERIDGGKVHADLKARIAELEAELAKRPVAYCLRHRDYGHMLLLGETQIFPTKQSAELAKREDWIVEPYTGEWK